MLVYVWQPLCKKITANVKERLNKHGRELNANLKSPFIQGYCPEMDTSPKLDDDKMSYYQYVIRYL